MTSTKIYRATSVFTGDPSAPLAEAVAVRGDRVLAVGDFDAVRSVAGSDTEEVDFGRALIAPGFVEGHTHMVMLGQATDKVQLRDCTSLEEIQHRLRERRRLNPDATQILGTSWMFEAVPGGQPTAAMLDAAVDDVPVVLDANDLHSVWVNSAALAAMGIDRNTPDPVGGEIVKDEHGEPTGFLLETAAMQYAWSYVDETATDEDRDRFLDGAFRVYLETGVTSATEMALGEVELAAFRRRLDRDGRLPFPVTAHWILRATGDTDRDLEQVERVAALRDALDAEPWAAWFRITGVKFVLDGVIDACTAAMRAPYANGALPEPIWSAERAAPVAAAADAAGLELALHAIGDHASDIALDVIEHCIAVNGLRPRNPRIEHLESVAPETIRRMAALGVTASMQPVHCDPAIMDNWQAMLGDERAETGFPWHWFREAGVRLALGSDAPTAPHEAPHNLFIALTTRSALKPGPREYHPERAFTPAQALAGFTSDAASVAGFGDGIGVLRAGGVANLTVVSADPFTADADELLDARTVVTLVNGEEARPVSNGA